MWQTNYFNNDYGMGIFRFILPIVLLDLVIRGFALWKSAKRDQNIWFIALLLVNSMGILPLIYLVLNRDAAETPKKKNKK